MRKVLSIVLCLTLLMGHCALLAIPAFADNDENTSSPPETNPPCSHMFGSYTDAGDNHTQTCVLCGFVYPGNHSFIDNNILKQPTCGEEGRKIVVCRLCNAMREEIIPPTGLHTLTNLSPVNDLGHSGTCSVCHLQANQPHSFDAGTVTKPATCAEPGERLRTCACGHTKTEAIAPSEQLHIISSLTAVDAGNHTGTCSVCSKTVTLPHTWDAGRIDIPATCLTEGKITYTCTGCGATDQRILEISDHNWTPWTQADEKIHKRVCTVCQEEEKGEHSYESEWRYDENVHYHLCDACGSQKDVKAHFPGPEPTDTMPQLCLICQCVLKPALNHVHDYSGDWVSDEEGHWHTCTECEEKDGYKKHRFENDCDADCNICGYLREVTHEYSDMWTCDSESHYHKCIHCETAQEHQAHTPGADGKNCAVCGYQLAADSVTQNPTTTTPAQKKKAFPAWGALVIAGVAAALIPVFAFFTREPDL